uniref:Malic enzyme n=1 Tax=Strigamia maritima TaxID=126957 RepID=T1IZH2_STRMM
MTSNDTPLSCATISYKSSRDFLPNSFPVFSTADPLLHNTSTLGTTPSITANMAKNNSIGDGNAKTSVMRDVEVSHSLVRSIDYLRDSKLNKGMAFSLQERQLLGFHGLLPACFKTQEEQVKAVLNNVRRYSEPLNQYIYLMNLQDRNEKLFYRTLGENVEELMPIVYTPTVGLACQKYGLIFQRPRGLFLSIYDAGHIYDILGNWPEQNVKAVVITDGERILGLGDLGACGMGIPVGKLALYTALAGINPSHCLPVLLDVGTNNKELLDDEFYIGLRQPRVQNQRYDDIVDEFMDAIVERYGSNCLIQFEDFGNHNAFRFMRKYQSKYCTFNDDIQGTASVAVAGVLASLRATNTTLLENTFFFLGAGEAALGIASLLVNAMVEQGASVEKARGRIWLADSKGLLVKSREGSVTEEKKTFLKEYKHLTDINDIVENIKPTVLIGAAAIAGAFNEKVLTTMASINKKPVIFALSNPTAKAECTAEQAYTYTKGTCVFASGSPFLPVTYNGRTFHPGQGNNSYIFPGVALGVIAASMHHISDAVFLLAAKTLSSIVTEKHLAEGRLYPPLETIQECSIKIATEVIKFAYKEKSASYYPEPIDKEAFIRRHVYDYTYKNSLPKQYSWPL